MFCFFGWTSIYILQSDNKDIERIIIEKKKERHEKEKAEKVKR